MKQLPDQDMLTVEEVAGFLRVHPRTVQRLLQDEKLKGTKVGRRWRIAKRDLLAYVQQYHEDESGD